MTRARRPARCADLDRACRGAVGAADRDHRAYLDRRRGRTLPVGGAACALSRDLRDRVPDAADPAAPAVTFIAAGSRSSLLVVSLALGAADQILVLIAINLVGFFLLALMCHGELARRRPPARYLTAFYLWLSLGGVIGGIFAGLIAQHIFSWVAEYPLLIILAALCRPGLAWPRGKLDIAAICRL